MLELKVKARQETGNKNKELRRQGFIPAVLYGHKVENLNLAIKYLDFERIFKKAGETTLIKLKIKDDEERIVLIKDISRDAVSSHFIHADFQQIKMDEVMTLEVPIIFIGESNAVEKENGVLIKNIQNLEIEAFPQDIPHEFEVGISVLNTFEDNIYVKDIKIPDKVKIKTDIESVVASVLPPKTQAQIEEEELDEKPTEAVEEVEVEKKGKEEKEEIVEEEATKEE